LRYCGRPAGGALRAALLAAGEAKNTYGTGCFLLEHIGTELRARSIGWITTLAASANRRLEYAFEGSVFIGGAVVQWLRDNLKLIAHRPKWSSWR